MTTGAIVITGAAFLLFVPSPGWIEINPIDAKPNDLLDTQFE